MKKLILALLLCLPFMALAQSNSTQMKILMVVSSYGKDMGATRPGYEFDEFSQAYLIFRNNGLAVHVASPKGGKVEADQFDKDKPYNQQVVADAEIMNALDETIPTSQVDATDYDAIYIVGGKGAMFDLPVDPSLQEIILNLYRREETVISSVCHGPASFVNVKDGDNYIVNGVELTSFCNAEEDLFGKKWVPEFPFLLEDKLKSRGANFTQTDFMLANVAISGKFITGQNPSSTTKSAEAVVKALGIEPVERSLYKDEKTIYLLQEVLDRTTTIESAAKELEEQTASFDIPLFAAYGYYKILESKDVQDEVMKGIEIVELTAPHFYNENLQFMLAKTYVSIDNKERAKEILTELISKELLMEKATALLAELG